MGLEEGFLQEIRQDIYDDDSRLIFADWLEDHDQPVRAELIRLQCHAATLPLRDPSRMQMEQRAKKLGKKQAKKWFPQKPKNVNLSFQRGMLKVTFSPVDTNLKRLLKWWQQHRPWIYSAEVWHTDSDELDWLMDAKLLDEVAELDISNDEISEAWLSTLGVLPNLKKLAVSFVEEGDGWGWMGSLSRLYTLQSLNLCEPTCPPSALYGLQSCRDLRELTVKLDLTDEDLGPIQELTQLRRLDCSFGGTWKKKVLQQLQHLTSLEEIHFHHGGDPGKGLKHLASVPTLKTLRVTYIHISKSTAREVASLPQLEELELCPTDRVGQGWLRALRPLEKLKRLDLSYSDFVEQGDLTHLTHLPALEWVNLNNSVITKEGLGALTSIPSLKYLFLSGARIRGRDLRLLESAQNLVALDLSGSGVTNAGVQYLSKIPSLRWIDLQGTEMTKDAIKQLRKALPDTWIESS